MGRRESGWREFLSGTQTLAHIGCNFLVTHLVYKDPKPSTPMTVHRLIPLDAAPCSTWLEGTLQELHDSHQDSGDTSRAEQSLCDIQRSPVQALCPLTALMQGRD